MIKFLPFILDIAADKIVKSLNDDKETKLDKVIRFLISDKMINAVTKFNAAYYAAVEKLKGEEALYNIAKELSKEE